MNELRRGEAGLAMMCSADSGMTYGQWMPMGPQDELAHFGIKGMKHGRRRYQTESGEWTPLGMKERRAREGFGDGKSGGGKTVHGQGAKTKAANDARKSSGFGLKSLLSGRSQTKNLTEAELKARIRRLELERDYKELYKEVNKSPLIDTAQRLVKAYSDAQESKRVREENKYKLENSRISSLAALKKAEADKMTARNDLIDNLTRGKGRTEAKVKLIEAKSKHTIKGALKDVANRVINKEGNRLVKEMGDKSLTMRVGQGIKNTTKNSYSKGKQLAKDVYNAAGDVVLDIKYGTGKKGIDNSLKG